MFNGHTFVYLQQVSNNIKSFKMIDLNRIWDFVKIVFLMLASIFAPIRVSITVLMFFFLLNFIVGFKNDEIVHHNKFSIKKAFEGLKLLILYYTIVFIVFTALSLFEEKELAEEATKFISWIICYWYLINVLRNSKEIFPWSRGLKFMYDIMTIEVLNVILERFGLGPTRKYKHHHGRDREIYREEITGDEGIEDEERENY